MNENDTLPELFSRSSSTKTINKINDSVIPQNTLYDTPISTQHFLETKHVTVFGFTQSNRKIIFDKISSLIKILRYEEGKNFINIWSEDIEDLENLVKLNHQVINGEIIGVYRKNFGIINDSDIYLKKRGVIQMINEYFFGK